jgi:Protein of unknown function (DUF1684).
VLYLQLADIIFNYKAQGQTFEDEIRKHRRQYIQHFLTDARSPIPKEDISYLDFFEPNKNYVIHAGFEPTADVVGFDMMTNGGKTNKYYTYGWLHFTINNKSLKLSVYKSDQLR